MKNGQSIGSDLIDVTGVGWEFREENIGKKRRRRNREKRAIDNTWSFMVLPGNARGKEEAARKKGAHARGLSKDHAKGLNLCLHQPKFPILGVVLTHGCGGASSPFMKSGGFSPLRFHQLGFPRSQNLSDSASMLPGWG